MPRLIPSTFNGLRFTACFTIVGVAVLAAQDAHAFFPLAILGAASQGVGIMNQVGSIAGVAGVKLPEGIGSSEGGGVMDMAATAELSGLFDSVEELGEEFGQKRDRNSSLTNLEERLRDLENQMLEAKYTQDEISSYLGGERAGLTTLQSKVRYVTKGVRLGKRISSVFYRSSAKGGAAATVQTAQTQTQMLELQTKIYEMALRKELEEKETQFQLARRRNELLAEDAAYRARFARGARPVLISDSNPRLKTQKRRSI